MKYSVKVNKRASYVRVYTVIRKIGKNENFLTNLFVKMLAGSKKGEQSSG